MWKGENMTELAEKRSTTKESNVYSFLTKNSLEGYLTDYVISKEVFNYGKDLSDYERTLLSRYYDDSKQRADRLVTDDEFVGITYDKLDIINSKLIKKYN